MIDLDSDRRPPPGRGPRAASPQAGGYALGEALLDAGHPQLRLATHAGTDFAVAALRFDGARPAPPGAEAVARMAMALRHPATLRVLDVVTQGDQLVLVTEHLDGVSLAGLSRAGLWRPGWLRRDSVIALAAALLEAVDELNRLPGGGLRHRCVGLETVLVSPLGQVRLAGCGLPLPAGQAPIRSPWASPDDASGDEHAAVALLILRLLWDVNLDGLGPDEATDALARGLRAIPADDPLRPVLTRLLTAEPARRYPDAAAAAAALHPLQSGGAQQLAHDVAAFFAELAAEASTDPAQDDRTEDAVPVGSLAVAGSWDGYESAWRGDGGRVPPADRYDDGAERCREDPRDEEPPAGARCAAVFGRFDACEAPALAVGRAPEPPTPRRAGGLAQGDLRSAIPRDASPLDRGDARSAGRPTRLEPGDGRPGGRSSVAAPAPRRSGALGVADGAASLPSTLRPPEPHRVALQAEPGLEVSVDFAPPKPRSDTHPAPISRGGQRAVDAGARREGKTMPFAAAFVPKASTWRRIADAERAPVEDFFSGPRLPQLGPEQLVPAAPRFSDSPALAPAAAGGPSGPLSRPGALALAGAGSVGGPADGWVVARLGGAAPRPVGAAPCAVSGEPGLPAAADAGLPGVAAAPPPVPAAEPGDDASGTEAAAAQPDAGTPRPVRRTPEERRRRRAAARREVVVAEPAAPPRLRTRLAWLLAAAVALAGLAVVGYQGAAWLAAADVGVSTR